MDAISIYINAFQEPVRSRLINLRSLVKSLSVDAEESISYAMPAYKLKGKPLIYFAGYKHHVGVYATPNCHEHFSNQLSSYKQGKGSVQFPNNVDFPIELIGQMIEFNREKIMNNLIK